MRKVSFAISLVLMASLSGLALSIQAAQPTPEPAPPRFLAEGLEELPFLDSDSSRLEPQQMVETASIVPWSKLVFHVVIAHSGAESF